ncbi:N-acetylmuramic acid 6-phosphate etherase [uncultured Kocuria sp.]|uniref:N-acetylmuramic acid 6-phosphate etherase n=1 Tax=uncultured Kocuria sp. TaxID=259305 RepID=UPI0025944EA7|nr:N-acetylmuramic acid 6-phosphate etherase [uncultured Kocuria sp.]MCT1367187.1 N-acetylmuramic acid 6-phosphate etherase [Rothia sp. p3-SID1597]
MSQSSPLTTTESVNAEFADLDRMSTEELARTMNRQDAVVPEAVAQRTTEIANLVEAALPGLRAGGRLIYAGAGTAGRLGVLDASECPPTFNTRPGQVVGLIAGGSEALVSAIEGAEDDADAGARAVAALDVGPEDTVVGVSASGRTPYAIGAVREAARRQATTASIACNEGSELAAAAQHPIDVVVGPELVAGSTRLKSGTAQKLVLNMISTIAMVRLGKTYGNLMVDVQSTNVKLRERVRRIVADVTGAGPQEVEDAVEGADGSAKVAILSILGGMTADQARTELDHHAGVLRAALERTGNHY